MEAADVFPTASSWAGSPGWPDCPTPSPRGVLAASSATEGAGSHTKLIHLATRPKPGRTTQLTCGEDETLQSLNYASRLLLTSTRLTTRTSIDPSCFSVGNWLLTYVGLETAAELIAQSKQADMEAEPDNAQESCHQREYYSDCGQQLAAGRADATDGSAALEKRQLPEALQAQVTADTLASGKSLKLVIMSKPQIAVNCFKNRVNPVNTKPIIGTIRN